jgi:hypothetical protein
MVTAPVPTVIGAAQHLFSGLKVISMLAMRKMASSAIAPGMAG